jgi:mannose-6-phosphate isomerase-like protein (cupin superfamily)/DNA-binding XRE family transcriptional regulator
MTDQIKLIAERMKDLREISGTSIETLAAAIGVTPDMLLQYESGTVDIPVGILSKIAHKNGIELSALLSGENPRLRVYCVVRNGKGLNVERRKQYKYEHLAYNFAHKKAEPFLVKIDPCPDNTPMEFNTHPGQEFNYVLEGTMKVVIDGHEIVLEEGDSVYYDSGYQHAMKALKNKPVTMLAIVL